MAAAAALVAAIPSSSSDSTPGVTHSQAMTAALADSSALLASLTSRFRANQSRARHMFLGEYGVGSVVPPLDEAAATAKLQSKIACEYASAQANVAAAAVAAGASGPSSSGVGASSTALARPARLVEEATGVLRAVTVEVETERAPRPARDTEELLAKMPVNATAAQSATPASAGALVAYGGGAAQQSLVPTSGLSARQMLIASKREIDDVRPEWHAPWKLMRVISAHAGWVRTIAVDHSNEWFATGSVDRTIKIFDLASGQLKLTLTGHISAIRGLAISKYTPYMFSVGEDKQVKCWDMTQNKVIRDYHGHLSGSYCCGLLENDGGPNILVTGGRDSVGRVWDIRTAAEVAVLCGHTQTVASIECQMGLPQVITGSHDTTIKLWDLRKTSEALSTLTNHKKSVRALQVHPTEYTFISGAGDNIKAWKCPEGTFLRNISGHNATINALTINRENVLVSGADNGTVKFWDYKSGHCFQDLHTPPQPGSLDAESGIFALKFDQTGSRLITAEADKTIKVYKEDENATEETHPLNWRPGKRRKQY